MGKDLCVGGEGGGGILNLFYAIIIIPTLFHTFYHSASPTSCYILMFFTVVINVNRMKHKKSADKGNRSFIQVHCQCHHEDKAFLS